DGGLLQENPSRNERCAGKNCTPRVVLNTNSGRGRAGTGIFSQTSASGTTRVANRERAWRPVETANLRAACARETLAKIAKTPRRTRGLDAKRIQCSEFKFRTLAIFAAL